MLPPLITQLPYRWGDNSPSQRATRTVPEISPVPAVKLPIHRFSSEALPRLSTPIVVSPCVPVKQTRRSHICRPNRWSQLCSISSL